MTDARIVDITVALRTPTEMITVSSNGEAVWKGTPEALGFLLAALRGDLVREWRCVAHPPCTPTETPGNTAPHDECGWIVYAKLDETESKQGEAR
jgi:hypothetical protein